MKNLLRENINQQNRLRLVKFDLIKKFEAFNRMIQDIELVINENLRFSQKYLIEKDICNEEIRKLDLLLFDLQNAKMKKLFSKSFVN